MMETAIELLSNNINGNSFKKWDDYLNIINGIRPLVGCKILTYL